MLQIQRIEREAGAGKGNHRYYIYHLLPTDRYRINDIDSLEDCVQKSYNKKKKSQPHQAWISPNVDLQNPNVVSTASTADDVRSVTVRREIAAAAAAAPRGIRKISRKGTVL